jgi:type VI secretion system protein ImpA
VPRNAEGIFVLDLAPWLSPIDGANPSGASLRDDPRFHEIERLMQPRIEVVRDERNNPVSQTAVPVDWAGVLARAEALRAEGRDLRLLVIVARALGNERSFAGLADGLTLIARTLEAHWDTLHPELRAGNPREAALRRINALLQLQNDEDGLLGDLSKKVFLEVRGFGAISGGELARANLDTRTAVAERTRGLGEKERAAMSAAIAAEHEQLVNRVRAACRGQAEAAPAEMAALVEGVRAAGEAFAIFEKALGGRIGVEGEVIDLNPLRTFLRRVRATLEHAEAPADAPAHATGTTVAPDAREAPAVAGNGPAMAAVPGRIVSREEVVACLDRIIEFYDRTEPASPVPFLARRMRRMVPMDFLELMEDLAPSGLKEFRALAGLGEDKKAASRNPG